MFGLNAAASAAHFQSEEYAATWHGDREIVSRDPEGPFHRTDYSQVAARAKRVANALDSLRRRSWRIGVGDAGVENSYRHLEVYYGITGLRAACCIPSTRDCFPN